MERSKRVFVNLTVALTVPDTTSALDIQGAIREGVNRETINFFHKIIDPDVEVTFHSYNRKSFLWNENRQQYDKPTIDTKEVYRHPKRGEMLKVREGAVYPIINVVGPPINIVEIESGAVDGEIFYADRLRWNSKFGFWEAH